jgi:hypothetical protein
MLASSSRDLPHPSLPTIITFCDDFSQADTIYISFSIDLVVYIFCTSLLYTSLYSPIFPFFITNDSGSLFPGTGLPNTSSNILPRTCYLKFDANPFTKFSLYYCSSVELCSSDNALLTSPTFVVSTAD